MVGSGGAERRVTGGPPWGAGEMSALSWEISTAAHRVPPKIAPLSNIVY